jgi:hypothetical protein
MGFRPVRKYGTAIGAWLILLEESIPFFRSAIGLVRRCIGNAAPSFLTTQLSLVALATYMHSMRV